MTHVSAIRFYKPTVAPVCARYVAQNNWAVSTTMFDMTDRAKGPGDPPMTLHASLGVTPWSRQGDCRAPRK